MSFFIYSRISFSYQINDKLTILYDFEYNHLIFIPEKGEQYYYEQTDPMGNIYISTEKKEISPQTMNGIYLFE